MSTLAEIEAAMDELPPTQQAELYAFLGARLEAQPNRDLSPDKFETWFKTAWSAGLPGITTDEIMAMTRARNERIPFR